MRHKLGIIVDILALAACCAHGAGIIKEGGRFYLFGEFKRDHSNGFNGYSCYSSPGLMNWKFENIALPDQKDGRLGPSHVGGRFFLQAKRAAYGSTGDHVSVQKLLLVKLNQLHSMKPTP